MDNLFGIILFGNLFVPLVPLPVPSSTFCFLYSFASHFLHAKLFLFHSINVGIKSSRHFSVLFSVVASIPLPLIANVLTSGNSLFQSEKDQQQQHIKFQHCSFGFSFFVVAFRPIGKVDFPSRKENRMYTRKCFELKIISHMSSLSLSPNAEIRQRRNKRGKNSTNAIENFIQSKRLSDA